MIKEKLLNPTIKILLSGVILLTLVNCNDNETIGKQVTDPDPSEESQRLSIFYINDQHGQLDNFAKIKHIVDAARDTTNALLVCAGDMFSGNPIVDQYSQKGYPMIDVMNKTGFDVSVLGNHEFDYGTEVLKQRVEQAEFKWVCANVDMQESGVEQPEAYTTIATGNLNVTFLGLVETNGKPDDVIPATHPWRVEQLKFQRFEEITERYARTGEEENADVYVALTHLGQGSDVYLAENFPYFDVIIGGHSHQVVDRVVHGVPIVQAGSYLNYLGRIDMILKDGQVTSSRVSLTDLNEYAQVDDELQSVIEDYNTAPEFDEVVGYANSHHERNELGCFYTNALKEYMEVDASFQNSGGIRSSIDQGDITALEIFNMDPFNNGSVIFTLTAKEIKDFFIETRAGVHVSGITLEQTQGDLIIRNEDGLEMADGDLITIGLNDYIPAVYDQYFPLEKADIQSLTTAETVIEYLKTINSTVDDEGCNRFFSYN
ncbi:MAG: bifunctional UDP-sugar hydrolase/5'-nucleotidase [Cyclobacteriaceae bacterium]